MSTSKVARLPLTDKAPHRRGTRPAFMTAEPESLDDLEIARRLLSLISLLAIYVLGLLLVALISDGPDIGVLLAAMFAHAVFTSVRWAVREYRDRSMTVVSGIHGIVVFSRRPRFIPYGDIASAIATDDGVTLRLRKSEPLVLRWRAGEVAVREVFLDRLFGRVRLATAAKRPRSRESIARIAAAIGELAHPSSTHVHAAIAG